MTRLGDEQRVGHSLNQFPFTNRPTSFILKTYDLLVFPQEVKGHRSGLKAQTADHSKPHRPTFRAA